MLINSTRPPEAFADMGDFRFATLDALAVAQKNELGRYRELGHSRSLRPGDGLARSRGVGACGAGGLAGQVGGERAGVRDGYRLVRIKGEDAITGADAARATGAAAGAAV